MLIMSIVHVSEIKSVMMRVDGDGLSETSKTSSRPSRIVMGDYMLPKLYYSDIFLGVSYSLWFYTQIIIDTTAV